MDRTIKNRLQELKGNTYLYRTRRLTVSHVQCVDRRVTISATEGLPISFSLDELEDRLTEFLPVSTDKEEASLKKYSGELQNDVTSMNSLLSTLLDSIDKVKDDPNYVKQADSIANLSKQVLDLSKTKIKVFNVVNKMNK
jgi:hypothetical protein